MAKVLVERPRWGSRLPSHQKGYRRFLQRTVVEDLPRAEPLAGRWRGRQKCFSENLSPLYRFLESQVGRPWNKVHQALCENVSFDNTVQRHVLSHVFQFVSLHVEIVDGILYELPEFGRSTKLRPGSMYVCPRTGLLKVVRPAKQQRPPLRHVAGPLHQFHFRDGCWWELKLRKLPENRENFYDVWLERPLEKLTLRNLIAAYGGILFATSRRPLTRHEARTALRGLKK
jgi:hypothetical protein